MSDSWSCPGCGAEVGGQGTMCYRCGARREGAKPLSQVPLRSDISSQHRGRVWGIGMLVLLVGGVELSAAIGSGACHGSACMGQVLAVLSVLAVTVITAAIWSVWSLAMGVVGVVERRRRRPLPEEDRTSDAREGPVRSSTDVSRPMVEGFAASVGEDGVSACPSCGQRTAIGPECQWCDWPLGSGPASPVVGAGRVSGSWLCEGCGRQRSVRLASCYRCGTRQDGAVPSGG